MPFNPQNQSQNKFQTRSNNMPPQRGSFYAKPEKKSKSKKIMVVLLIVMLFLGSAVGVLWILSKTNLLNTQANTQQQTPQVQIQEIELITKSPTTN